MRTDVQPVRYLAMALTLLLIVCLLTPVNAVAEKKSPADKRPQTMDTLDQTGKKVSVGIDRIGDRAADRLGQWVALEAFFGITWFKLLICMSLMFGVVVFERLMRWFINRRIERIPQKPGAISWIRLLLKATVSPLSLFVWVYGTYGALAPLFGHFQTPDGANLVYFVFRKAADIGIILAIFWFIYLFVNLVDARLQQWAGTTDSTIDDVLVPLVGKTLRLFIITLGGIIIIQNLTGVEIGPLLASLGIGGVAVALAAKDSIANFFGTLTVLFDKPFQVGDRIVLENYDGVVENVGFRSTRIRLLSGHLVTIPNEKVINSGLENIGKRPFIRWLTNIGITYDTPPDKIEKAVEIIESILENHEGLNPDLPPRVYFNGFNDWSLNIMVIVWYHPPNYWDLQSWIQRTCLEITRQFHAHDIDFAFPSQTLHLANDAKRQLKLEMVTGGGLNQEE